MSALIPEPFIAVTPTLIRTFGAVPAIVLQEIHFLTLVDYLGGSEGECVLFHREIADRTGLSLDQVWRATKKLVDAGVLRAEVSGEQGDSAQASKRVRYEIVHSQVPVVSEAPRKRGADGRAPRKRGASAAKARRSAAKARRSIPPDQGKHGPKEVEEEDKKSSSSSTVTPRDEPATESEEEDVDRDDPKPTPLTSVIASVLTTIGLNPTTDEAVHLANEIRIEDKIRHPTRWARSQAGIDDLTERLTRHRRWQDLYRPPEYHPHD